MTNITLKITAIVIALVVLTACSTTPVPSLPTNADVNAPTLPATAPRTDKIQPTTPPSIPITAQPGTIQQPLRITFVPPTTNAAARVTKKPFGIHITPATSPVQPERFSGYHTGTDFEMLTDADLTNDVAINAVCSGTLLVKEYASGYGGVAVQSCMLQGKPITVVYGHLRLASIKPAVNEKISAGQFLGNLGTGYSKETDGERRHLHLGFHLGSSVNIKGYVATQAELKDWVDPCIYLCK
jgi:hypothetical protein